MIFFGGVPKSGALLHRKLTIMEKTVMKPMNVGLLGLGTVGGGTLTVLRRNAAEITRRAGREIRVTMAAARDLDKAKHYASAGLMLTDNPFAVVDNLDIDIVVEMMGGISPAKELILRAIENGKHVVTANKALIANHGTEIFAAAQKKVVVVAFEAAVGGGYGNNKKLCSVACGEMRRPKILTM